VQNQRRGGEGEDQWMRREIPPCVAVGPNNQHRPSGTLLIPGPQAGAVLNTLLNEMKELQRKQQEQAAPAGRA
jgi:hypothetical protein